MSVGTISEIDRQPAWLRAMGLAAPMLLASLGVSIANIALPALMTSLHTGFAGAQWVEAHLTLNPLRLIAVGLLAAVLTGVGSMLLGYPFLTSYFTYATLPVIGRIPLASAIIFDLGVFTLVVGATVLILIALAHQSVRSHRPGKTQAPVPARDEAP